ncbi:unannotated protein [freshwater metagenome]|uniref:Unannotated protein n=1 Tax=freshwater metagenome TaxID=449393 RepID=A0A6J6IYM5_9ZZZZ
MIVITKAHCPKGVSAVVERSIISPPIKPNTKEPVLSSSDKTTINVAI